MVRQVVHLPGGANIHGAACGRPHARADKPPVAKYPLLQVVSRPTTEIKKKKIKKYQRKPKKMAVTDGLTVSVWDFFLNLICYQLM